MRYHFPGAAALLACLLLLGACEPPPAPAADPEPAVDDEAQSLTVLVHFTVNEQPVPLERDVGARPDPLRAALEAQLEGPTSAEREAGLFSFFSAQTAGMLTDVRVDELGLVTIDFEDFSGVIPNASTSAGSAILLGELNATVFQFPAVRALTYRFVGNCEAFWEWLQVGGCPVIERPAPV